MKGRLKESRLVLSDLHNLVGEATLRPEPRNTESQSASSGADAVNELSDQKLKSVLGPQFP